MTISRLEIVDPTDTTVDWWSSAAGLKGLKRLDFEAGLNVILAPNGYGKSTILKTMATLSHSVQGGVPLFTQTSFEPWARGRGKGARLVGDGALTFYADPSERPGLIGGMAGFDGDFMADGVMSAMCKSSTGEWCVRTLNRVVGLAIETKSIEDRTGYGLERLRKQPMYAAWQATQVAEPGSMKPTILIDEFDRSLDFPMVVHVWALLALHAQHKHQLIVAAHNPLVLKLADAGLCNLIDLCPGYANACRERAGAFDAVLASAFEPNPAPIPPPYQWRQPIVPDFEKPARKARRPK